MIRLRNSMLCFLFIFSFVLIAAYVTFVCVVNLGCGKNIYTIFEPAYPPYHGERIIGECTVTITTDYFPFSFENYFIVYEVNVLADINIDYNSLAGRDRLNCTFQTNLISHDLYNHQFSFRLPKNGYNYKLPNDLTDGKAQPTRVFADRGYYEIIRIAQKSP